MTDSKIKPFMKAVENKKRTYEELLLEHLENLDEGHRTRQIDTLLVLSGAGDSTGYAVLECGKTAEAIGILELAKALFIAETVEDVDYV